MLFARPNGELLDMPDYKLVGRSGNSFVEPLEEELIPLPQGATLTAIPNRFPVGIKRDTGDFGRLRYNPYEEKNEEVWAVGALLPQGFTRTLIPAFSGGKEENPLPLLGYTAVGIKNGKFVVAANATDEQLLWNPENYNTANLEDLVNNKIKQFPQNRIVAQLGTCALEYGCFTAQNIFYERWEGGLPISPVCNARCLGCISSQPSECCPAPQRRLDFVPSYEEIVELAVSHLQHADQGIISFGQGCEGEPSLQGELIAQSIAEIRKQTPKGTININTNAGYTSGIKKIVDAGLDTMRVSIISPNAEIYQAYYRPHNYQFSDVVASLRYAGDAGVFTSVNLLAMPGVTDDESEIEKLIELIENNGVRKVQLRNLNIDPDTYMKLIPKDLTNPLGIPAFIDILKEELPDLEIGNYSRAVTKKQ